MSEEQEELQNPDNPQNPATDARAAVTVSDAPAVDTDGDAVSGEVVSSPADRPADAEREAAAAQARAAAWEAQRGSRDYEDTPPNYGYAQQPPYGQPYGPYGQAQPPYGSYGQAQYGQAQPAYGQPYDRPYDPPHPPYPGQPGAPAGTGGAVDAFFSRMATGFSTMSSAEQRKLIFKALAFVCGLVVLSIALASFFMMMVSYAPTRASITPADLIKSWSPRSVTLGMEPDLYAMYVSFYVYKVFYTVFAVLLGVTFAAFIFHYFCAVANLPKGLRSFSKKLSGLLMNIVVMMMFISVLAGYNFASLFITINDSLASGIRAQGFAPFIFALIFLLAGHFLNMEKPKENILQRGDKSIAVAFVLLVLQIVAWFIPLYIVHMTKFRMTPFDLVFGSRNYGVNNGLGDDMIGDTIGADPNTFNNFPITSAFRGILIFFIILAFISFAVCLALYFIKKNWFARFSRFNTYFGITVLIVYAVMGVNYLLVYVDTFTPDYFLLYAFGTYSYLPLALFGLFLLGWGLAHLVTSRMKVEYKIFTSGDGRFGDRKKAASTPAAVQAPKVNEAEVPDPIPAFSEIDLQQSAFEEAYAIRSQNIFPNLTLPALVSHIVDYAMNSAERLSYSVNDIKAFVAGLAASKLSILQGMSGTGKTSLPRVFMEAIDGLCEIIAVESSWRDKNELIGYYNEFNKKFTPKEFTQFLYKATFNRDVPVFIVLDELNLSRIEYYFSDFLSLMESRENERFIKLFDVQLYPDIDDREDYLSLRDGHTLDIPPNVWFIGTANRDESTFEISAKVYDRANTLNFDKRAPKIYETQNIHFPKKFVPYGLLKSLFEKAKHMEFNAETYETIRKAEQALRPYKISFGNRTLRQIEDFVKVYVACSVIKKNADREKMIAEAVDTIILSKVVRRLEFKQIGDLDSLIEEFEEIDLPKCREFLASLQAI